MWWTLVYSEEPAVNVARLGVIDRQHWHMGDLRHAGTVVGGAEVEDDASSCLGLHAGRAPWGVGDGLHRAFLDSCDSEGVRHKTRSYAEIEVA